DYYCQSADISGPHYIF
nr:immunoglobulin light chain junction region [Macaca mulatta]MOW71750.1 immunoglobulin light chain junction region [Macaca mulatta]MOW72089.1 immunoglobulin light chain junction region [Macaca mulatta]